MNTQESISMIWMKSWGAVAMKNPKTTSRMASATAATTVSWA